MNDKTKAALEMLGYGVHASEHSGYVYCRHLGVQFDVRGSPDAAWQACLSHAVTNCEALMSRMVATLGGWLAIVQGRYQDGVLVDQYAKWWSANYAVRSDVGGGGPSPHEAVLGLWLKVCCEVQS